VGINDVRQVVYELEGGVGDQLELQGLDQENLLRLQEAHVADLLLVDDSHESFNALALISVPKMDLFYFACQV
jgi:hypothetical protein